MVSQFLAHKPVSLALLHHFKIIETLIMNATAAGNIKLLSGPEKRETGAQDCFCSHQAVFYFMLT